MSDIIRKTTPEYEYFGKGITVTSGFDLNAQAPLDHRTVSKTIEDLLLMENIKKYEGLVVRVLGVGSFEYVPVNEDEILTPEAQKMVDGDTGYRWAKVYTEENLAEIMSAVQSQLDKLIEDRSVTELVTFTNESFSKFTVTNIVNTSKEVLIKVNGMEYLMAPNSTNVATFNPDTNEFTWKLSAFTLDEDDTVTVTYSYVDNSANKVKVAKDLITAKMAELTLEEATAVTTITEAIATLALPDETKTSVSEMAVDTRIITITITNDKVVGTVEVKVPETVVEP